jgi:hypothetical protein
MAYFFRNHLFDLVRPFAFLKDSFGITAISAQLIVGSVERGLVLVDEAWGCDLGFKTNYRWTRASKRMHGWRKV